MKKNVLQIDKHDYWMAMCCLFASRSPTCHSALIVEFDGNLVSVSDNRPPVPDHPLVPSEFTAILNCNSTLQTATLYTTRPPNPAVVELAVAKQGLRKMVFLSDGTDLVLPDNFKNGIYFEVIKFEGNLNWIRDYVDSFDYLSNIT